VCVGFNCQALLTANGSAGLGSNLTISANNALSLGYKTTVSANQGTAIGYQSAVESAGINGIAIGSGSLVSGSSGMAIGGTSKATASCLALGSNSYCAGASSQAQGASANASAQRCVAIGNNAKCNGWEFGSSRAGSALANNTKQFCDRKRGEILRNERRLRLRTSSVSNGTNSYSFGTGCYNEIPNSALFCNDLILNTTLRLNSTAMAWDDFVVPASALGLVVRRIRLYSEWMSGLKGINLLEFSDQSVAGNEKEVGGSAQMPHAWAYGTNIEPHIHLGKKTNTFLYCGVRFRVPMAKPEHYALPRPNGTLRTIYLH